MRYQLHEVASIIHFMVDTKHHLFLGLPLSLYQLPLTKFIIFGCKKLPRNTVELICQHMTQLEDLDIGSLDITGKIEIASCQIAVSVRFMVDTKLGYF